MKDKIKAEIVQHFARRSDVYDAFGTWVNNDDVLSSITSFLPNKQGRLDIVDLGSGTGAVASYIINNYSHVNTMVAVDVCEDMLKRIDSNQITKIVSPLENMPFKDNVFDVAVSRQCLHYINDLKKTISEIVRILKNNGIFVLSQIVPLESSTRSYWEKIIRLKQPLRYNYFSEKEWLQLFAQAGFKLISMQRFSHRSSIKKWTQKYTINNFETIETYKMLLLSASQQFMTEYNVKVTSDDIFYDSFWFVAKFQI
jgi:ubiquinone/menaquinone biosynthesis C-methylase UbiE